MRKKTFIALGLLVLSGCAGPQADFVSGTPEEIRQEAEKQKELALEDAAATLSRLHRVAFPLWTANAPLCGDHIGPYTGIFLWTRALLPAEYHAAAWRLYGLDDQPAVRFVVAGTPAARAGLRAGDKIISLSGHPVKPGKDGYKSLRAALKRERARDLRLGILRGGVENEVAVKAMEGCAYAVDAGEGDGTINAFADGRGVYIQKAFMRFLHDDGELALVMGHELAHNTQQHMRKRKQNAMGGRLLGLALDAGAMAAGVDMPLSMADEMEMAAVEAYSVAFEQEADYVGLYMAARAGYPYSDAANLWRRIGSQVDPGSVEVATTHPPSAARFVALEKTKQEIAAKVGAGAPLVPNLRKK